MTVIAYRNGILAADSCIAEDGVNVGSLCKLVRTPKGELVAAYGDADGMALMLQWAKLNFKRLAKFNALASSDVGAVKISKDGTVMHYEGRVGFYKLDAPFHAAGTGASVAIGAMAAGATAEEAAKIACRYVSGCAEPVHVLKLGEV